MAGDDSTPEPPPAETPKTVIAALGPKMLALAGPHTDGAHPTWSRRRTPRKPAASWVRASSCARDGEKMLATRRPDPSAAPDGNHDMMLEFMNKKDGGEWASLPVVVIYTKDFRELYRYLEYPAIYHKDRVRSHQQAARSGETAEQARDRGMREFGAMQASPFFDLWPAAGIDEILSALYEKRVLAL